MLCYYFSAEFGVASLRSRKFARYLTEFGWGCEILTGRRVGIDDYRVSRGNAIRKAPNLDIEVAVSWVAKKYYQWLKSRNRWQRNRRIGNGVNPGNDLQKDERIRGMGIATALMAWLSLPDCQLLWPLLAFPMALFLSRRCRVIYSSQSPASAHVLGLLLKIVTGLPWIADYRDEWTLNVGWRPATKFHKYLANLLDSICVRRADLVINTTEIRTKMFFERFHGEESKYVTLYNGYDDDDLRQLDKSFPPVDKIVMTSLGTLYGGRDASIFLKALRQVVSGFPDKRERIAINIVGSGSDDIADCVREEGLQDIVRILPEVPYNEALTILSQSHIGLVFGSEMERYAMPTKTYEYAGMGKRIFALVPEGPVRDFVARCKGWYARPGDVDDVKRQMGEIFRSFDPASDHTDVEVSEYVREFERRALTERLASCFDNLVPGAPQKA